MKKSAPQPLYIYRSLIKPGPFIDWFKEQGFKTVITPDELHVTVMFSRRPVDWMAMGTASTGWTGGAKEGHVLVPEGGPRVVEKLGPKGAVVQLFSCEQLTWRHNELVRNGCSWDYPSYQPHVTITYDGGDVDLSKVEPYTGPLEFGPEMFEAINEHYGDSLVEKKSVQLFKLDDEARVAYGWASVITEKGVPVVDLQGDVIVPSDMVKATTDFMMDVRKALVMHDRNDQGGIDDSMIKGVVVHSLPLTAEIAKSLGISADREGWIVGVKVLDDSIWKAVKDGKLACFSIGGSGDRIPHE